MKNAIVSIQSSKKRKFTNQFKTQVVLDLLQGGLTLNQVSKKYSLHPTQIRRWKTIFLENLPQIFDLDNQIEVRELHQKTEELERIIGQLTIENQVLKKSLENWN